MTKVKAKSANRVPGLRAADAMIGEAASFPSRASADTPDETRDTRRAFEGSDYPYAEKLKRAVYEAQKAALQVELQKMKRWVKETQQKILLLFEGRDAAGKGGTIKRFTEHLNPRGATVVALEKPTERERKQWYFQRYVAHLPSGGEIALFDRSWYNRAGVERVMGFCTPTEYLEFMRQAPELERMFVRSGIRLYEYWFSVSQAEQSASLVRGCSSCCAIGSRRVVSKMPD